MVNVEEIVKEYRNKPIEGRTIDLVPLKEEFCGNIVELRNKKRNMYYLSQGEELSLQKQLEWYKKYQERYNDIYWCILKKNGDFIGTIRLYDINRDENILEHGSFMIDEDYAAEGSYAIEAELMSLDFAFGKIKISKVINTIRHDNGKMSSLACKLGFKYIKEFLLKETIYKYYLLLEEDYKNRRVKIDELIDIWIKREG